MRKKQKVKLKMQNKGFTLIEVLVATFLISIIFLGIFGGFQLAIRVVSQSRAKMGAVYLANQRIEELRNLAFVDIQTGESTIILNGISYNIQTLVEVFDDCADGTIEGFDCAGGVVLPDTAPNDYKKSIVRVFWTESWGGEMALSTIFTARGIETGEGKGALRIALSDSSGEPIEILTGDQLPPCPTNTINIINEGMAINQCYGTDLRNPGVRLLILDASLSPNDYKIVVQKQGYASCQTFRAGDEHNGRVIANPLRKNSTIKEGMVYPITFIIDRISDLTVRTAIPWGGDSFFDTFSNENKIFEISDLIVNNGKLHLATSSPVAYFASGYLVSTTILPDQITQWHQLEWSDFEEMQTDISYQVFYSTSSDWHLVPENSLPGNALGFDSSPVDLSELNIEQFFKLRIKANFFTNDLGKTPFLHDWGISWKNGEATPISYVNFDLRGEKIVGTDINEQPIFKHSTAHITDGRGAKELLGIETDNYHFSGFRRGGEVLNLNTELSPMPFNILPGTSTTFVLYLESDNSLLVRVQDSINAEPILGAMVQLSHPLLGYNRTQSTNTQGEVLFIPLEAASNYNLSIHVDNYYGRNYSIDIQGNTYKNVNIEGYE